MKEISFVDWNKEGVLKGVKSPQELITRLKSTGLDHIFKIAEDFRVKHGKNGNCYLSFEEWIFIYDNSVINENNKSPGDMFGIIAAANWRIGKIIYRFDRELYSAIIDTNINTVPSDTLRKLPFICGFVELDVKVGCVEIYGFFPNFNDYEGKLLNIILMTNIGIMPIEINVNNRTIEQSITGLEKVTAGSQLHDFFIMTSSIALSILMYLCSVNADYNTPLPSETKRNKNGEIRFIGAKKEQIIYVGERIGAALRNGIYRASSASAGAISERTMCPHIRRAHWHTFLTGPRNSERVPIVKWIPPTLVNVSDIDEMPVTIRPVKK